MGSSLIGQSFTDADGNALPQYFQSRPSAAGDGYDPMATSASNLGPESIVDTPGDPSLPTSRQRRQAQPAHPGLLTQRGRRRARRRRRLAAVLHRRRRRRRAVGDRPARLHAATSSTRRRVVSVNEPCDTTPRPFLDTYEGVRVECADVRRGLLDRPDRADPRRAPGRPGGARRRRHRQRQRPGPAHLPRVRRPAGEPGRRGPRRQPRPGPRVGRGHTDGRVPRVHGRADGSTCWSSTSHSMRNTVKS